jgi:hypothetical protein
MSTDETYNGWTNRETWAVVLHINNDQGWQESVTELVRNTVEGIQQDPPAWLPVDSLTDTFYANRVGDAIRENVEETLAAFPNEYGNYITSNEQRMALDDIGSMWRVDWREVGASFLSDLDES